MKTTFSLCLLATLPCWAQDAVDAAAFPRATLEGWGIVTLPVPPGYEATGFKGEKHFVFSLAKPKQKPALEIYNGFEPSLTTEGEKCYAEIAGKRRRGVIVPQENGGTTHEFLLDDGPAGSVYLVTLHPTEDAAAIQAALAELRFDTKPTESAPSRRSIAADTPPAESTAAVKTFRGKGTFSLPVPNDVRVVESRDGEAYLFSFLTEKGTCAASIYSGYAPAQHTGGKPCTAVIAGQKTEGSKFSGAEEPMPDDMSSPGAVPTRGEEYLLQGGAEGALYHITVYETPHRDRMLAMLAAMGISGGSGLPDSARQQVTALRTSAEDCVRNANLILSKVKDRESADAAAAQLAPLADIMQSNDKNAAALQQRYGRALQSMLRTPDKPDSELSPTTSSRRSSPENEIQRVHDADCYGSEALEQLLLRFLGIDND